ncbi:TIGR00303 family protein [Spirulina sp. CCNP1310]|uniref:nicotinate mononucleotide-dependent phosphoribosyltransferase CobT n=1 Tax=Spirulina sp. CCNP1310 TaxID=3110249 RepID=UPI002B1F85AA|nr:TIGR00303 family protein [Spirulina sp. CCNP1310]MEA5421475.1 TIGR00303 family protein [Spirulina sp. CCNP1310]
MIKLYTQPDQGQAWLSQQRHKRPHFACILGFTATGLHPGISAAGATPTDRQYTAIADAEFLINGPHPDPAYPLPPLDQGASPVLISRAVVSGLAMPVHLFNSGLPQPPTVPCHDLGGMPAQCVSTGKALPLGIVEDLFQQGLNWGDRLSGGDRYLLIGECVVGGTTTALGVLLGLGIAAAGKVNSSHPQCNHGQKFALVQTGFAQAGLELNPDPLRVLAAVGDPMQCVAAGMAMAASGRGGVLLAGGTQMLAVYGVAQAIHDYHRIPWEPAQIVVGTTRWVAEDPTGDTVGLAEAIGPVPLLATELNFTDATIPTLRAYEQGYVKEGVGAGGCAIAATLTANWQNQDFLREIEAIAQVL